MASAGTGLPSITWVQATGQLLESIVVSTHRDVAAVIMATLNAGAMLLSITWVQAAGQQARAQDAALGASVQAVGNGLVLQGRRAFSQKVRCKPS